MERTDLVSQYQQILSEGRRRGLAEENKSSVEHQLHQRVLYLEDEKREVHDIYFALIATHEYTASHMQ